MPNKKKSGAQANGAPKRISRRRTEEGVSPTSEWVEFRRSRIHGMGGYAAKDIRKGTRIIEYVGRKIDKKESLRQCELDNRYIFCLNDTYDLDGKVKWNPARYINHGCEPNCETDIIRDRVWVIARRNIEAGEELTYNYNYDLEEYKDHPCRCGAAGCVGFIVAEEHFDHVRKANALRKEARKSAGKKPVRKE